MPSLVPSPASVVAQGFKKKVLTSTPALDRRSGATVCLLRKHVTVTISRRTATVPESGQPGGFQVSIPGSATGHDLYRQDNAHQRTTAAHRRRQRAGPAVTCPFCASVWVATGFTAGLVFVPRTTRLAAGTLAVLASADMLHFIRSLLEQAAES